MSHPQGPDGQGRPGQQPGSTPHDPGRPPRPGFAPYGFRDPAPRPSPSGATGIAAAVLAGLGAVGCLGGSLVGLLGLVGIDVLGTESRIQTSVGISGAVLPVLIFGIVLGVVSGILLAAGSVALARRTMTGRRLVAGGCAATIAGNLLSLGYAASAMGPHGSAGAIALLGFLVPIVTLILVLVPSTTAWIKAKRVAAKPY